MTNFWLYIFGLSPGQLKFYFKLSSWTKILNTDHKLTLCEVLSSPAWRFSPCKVGNFQLKIQIILWQGINRMYVWEIKQKFIFHLYEFHSALAFTSCTWRWWKLSWEWDEDGVTPCTLIIVYHHMHLVLFVLRAHRHTESDRNEKIRKLNYPKLGCIL